MRATVGRPRDRPLRGCAESQSVPSSSSATASTPNRRSACSRPRRANLARSSGRSRRFASTRASSATSPSGKTCPASGRLDYPRNLAGIGADDGDVARERFDQHPPELFGPAASRSRGQDEHVHLGVRLMHSVVRHLGLDADVDVAMLRSLERAVVAVLRRQGGVAPAHAATRTPRRDPTRLSRAQAGPHIRQ